MIPVPKHRVSPGALTILVDMDGILYDLTRRWLGIYNERYQDNLQLSQLTDYYVGNHMKKAPKGAAEGIIKEPDFFKRLPMLDGAAEAAKALHDMGHNVYIASSPVNGDCARHKLHSLLEDLPWLHEKRVFLGQAKWMIRADVLIDDAPRNLKNYRKAWPESLLLTIGWPFHDAATAEVADLIAPSYLDTRAAWGLIVDRVQAQADQRIPQAWR